MVLVVLALVALLVNLLVGGSPAAAASLIPRYRVDPLPGVEVWGLGDPATPLSVDVGRVARGAPVHIEVVRAGDAVAGDPGRLETPSGACRRVGGILCINGDFSECSTCGASLGGLVHDGVLERSPTADQPQVVLSPGKVSAGPLLASAVMVASVTFAATPTSAERTEQTTLALDAVNRSRGPDQVVLFTPHWSGSTRTALGGDEGLLSGGPPVLGTSVPVIPQQLLAGAGATPIPTNGMIISAGGTAVAKLRTFWAAATDSKAVRRSVVLRPQADQPVEESIGGYPSILAGGQSVIDASLDPFATSRQPRTMVGWNAAGDLWFVTVDGRQPGLSQGVSLSEGVEVLRGLGATDGFNLDGGGSSTFVSLPPGGGRTPVVLNRPSDGVERRMATFLAVIPNNRLAFQCDTRPLARATDALPTPIGLPPQPTDGAGYRMVARDGGVFTFGDAGFYGALGEKCLGSPVVQMAPTPSGGGYWMVAADGSVVAAGDANFYGSLKGIPLNLPIVGLSATPTGRGYWLVASDGGIFAYGDARFLGSTGAVPLNKPIVGMSATPSGRGYWLVASDGGIFAYGDARFLGSTGAVRLNRPIVGMASASTGAGYWMVATDGGIFAFGDASFQGSMGARKLNAPIVGMAARATGAGYWLVASDGGIFTFGTAGFLGSTGAVRLSQPIVGMTRTV